MCPPSGENYCIHKSLVLGVLVGFSIQSADQKPPIQCDKYQWRMDTVIFSWWWAHGCSNNVEKRNKYIEENCAPSWIYLQEYTGMHGQQNIKNIYFLKEHIPGCIFRTRDKQASILTHSFKLQTLKPSGWKDLFILFYKYCYIHTNCLTGHTRSIELLLKNYFQRLWNSY